MPVEAASTAFDEDGRLPLHIFTPPMPAGPQPNPPDVKDYTLAYKDDDDDLVLMTADTDVQDSVKVAQHQGKDRVLLVLHGGKTWDEAAARDGQYSSASAVTAANHRRQRELAEDQARNVQRSEQPGRAASSPSNEPLFGFLPRDMALPAAIGFASVVGLAAACIFRFAGRP